MIKIFTTTSCLSCKKAKSWFEKMGLKYVERNIIYSKLTKNEVLEILRHSECGFDDIISKQSKILVEKNVNIDKMSFSKLVDFIIENPKILKRPIIIDDEKFLVGYNVNDIRVFIPREQRPNTFRKELNF